MKNNLDEYTKDGCYKSTPFKPKRYLGEYLTHLVGVADVSRNKETSNTFKATMEKWAKTARYVANKSLLQFLNCFAVLLRLHIKVRHPFADQKLNRKKMMSGFRI